jgi:hypothetical protein
MCGGVWPLITNWQSAQLQSEPLLACRLIELLAELGMKSVISIKAIVLGLFVMLYIYRFSFSKL